MPGGRLTQAERQQIALGLADSLAYAEIARRLDRPTSTITREVMRTAAPPPTAPTWPTAPPNAAPASAGGPRPEGPRRPRRPTDATPKPYASTRRYSPPPSCRQAHPK
jgi:hypothetical protein